MVFNYTAVDILLLLIAVAVIPTLSVLAGRTYARTPRSELHLVGRYWFIIARGIIISLLILGAWCWSGRPYSTLGLDVPIGFRGRVGFALDAVLGCCFAFELLVRRLSPERVAAMHRRLESNRISPQTRAEFALFPFVGIVGSTFEELLYRGFLIWFFTPLAGMWGAVLLSAMLFGIAHVYQGLFGVVRTGLIGLSFGAAYALTHSLWWLILAHISLNIFGALFARKLMHQSAAPRPVTSMQ